MSDTNIDRFSRRGQARLTLEMLTYGDYADRREVGDGLAGDSFKIWATESRSRPGRFFSPRVS